MKHTPRKIALGYGFTFTPHNGCLTHPGGHLTSWFRPDGVNGFSVLEWATYLAPAMAEKVCNALRDPEVLAGRVHLPLRKS